VFVRDLGTFMISPGAFPMDYLVAPPAEALFATAAEDHSAFFVTLLAELRIMNFSLRKCRVRC
jgi:hypothetical protein